MIGKNTNGCGWWLNLFVVGSNDWNKYKWMLVVMIWKKYKWVWEKIEFICCWLWWFGDAIIWRLYSSGWWWFIWLWVFFYVFFLCFFIVFFVIILLNYGAFLMFSLVDFYAFFVRIDWCGGWLLLYVVFWFTSPPNLRLISAFSLSLWTRRWGEFWVFEFDGCGFGLLNLRYRYDTGAI